jgi:hypothetical protein
VVEEDARSSPSVSGLCVTAAVLVLEERDEE